MLGLVFNANPTMAQSPPINSLRIGTRGSKLARAQAESLRVALEHTLGCACELVLVKTSGDRIQDKPLYEVGGKGLFTKELEEALLAGKIDVAVHSMKDVPTVLPEGLTIGAVLPREDVRDAFISNKANSFEELARGACIGTSSVRRLAQIARARPDLKVVPLRGNVDTRLAKLDSGEYDAILLAQAGLNRLALTHRATSIMPLEAWLPALGQGAVGVEVRLGDETTGRAVALLNDQRAATALACERAFQLALDGSCRTPIAGLATVDGRRMTFRGEVLARDGSESARTDLAIDLGQNPVEDAAAAGRTAGLSLRSRALVWLEH
jgi:hydroxymethylbilane synthase